MTIEKNFDGKKTLKHGTRRDETTLEFGEVIRVFWYLRAIARRRGRMAGDPGGVSPWRFASSTDPVVFTVILCLKSSGKEIFPGVFLRNCSKFC